LEEKKHNEEVAFLKRSHQQLKQQLESDAKGDTFVTAALLCYQVFVQSCDFKRSTIDIFCQFNCV
jgi:hypothetical protein